MAPPRPLAVVAALLALLALGAASVVRIGPVPRLLPFLDPVRGVWAVAGAARPPAEHRAAIPGLTAEVDVRVDHRGVPHIFAATEEDAYRAMGYLVARDRLFQLELQTRAAAGTLTELLGAQLLEADRSARRMGLAWSAERKLRALDPASLGARAIYAYADGVNAYLDGLRSDRLPLEYRLLDRRPTRWEPLHSLLLFARMGLTLASADPADSRLAAQALVGAEAADALVPVNSPIQEPIQPNGRGGPRHDFRALPPPGPPDSAAAALAALRRDLVLALRGEGDRVGSNNWAVAPRRTREGHALLAGDPHLELTLPSIWYEVHVVVPGVLDVAGVSLPGSPGVVIGLNRDLAWTFTNTGADVLDLYQETVNDPAAPTSYRLDGAWRPLTLRVEEYRDPRGRLLATDTVRYTHRGPMVRRGPAWLSTRWTVHDPSAETDLFLRAGLAASADQWLAIMQGYVAPTQNGLVADRSGVIAIQSAGHYPRRPGDGRGDGVRDGSTSGADWTGLLPVAAYPFARSPAQGFLASANQQPVDPEVSGAYLGADWPAPWRALRINQLLRPDSAVTVETMRRMQTDPGSARADAFVPYFLDAARRAGASAGLARAGALLAEWSRVYEPDDRRAVLFELAMEELTRRTWDELGLAGEGLRFTPSSAVLLALLADPGSPWWDVRATADTETRDRILAASLEAALDSALARHGPPEGDGWRWSQVQSANIWHLLRLPSLSALRLPVRGGPSTLAPLSGRGTHGPSWRMVVELGPVVRAWGTYPGGQSGNPVSPWYDDRIPGWVAGELAPLLLPRTPGDLPADRVAARVTLRPGER